MTRPGRPEILPVLAFTLLTATNAYSSDVASGDCAQLPAGPVLTLEAAADRLDRCNPSLLTARAAVAAADADITTADHAPNPTLGLSTSNINPKVGVGNGSLKDRTVDSAIRLDQLIERGGKRAARRDTARASASASRFALRDMELQAQQALLESYTGAAAAAESMELLQQAAASYRQSADAMSRRLRAGDVARIEVNRTTLDAGRAEADAQAAAVALTQARAALAALLGAAQLPDETHLLTLEQLAARRTSSIDVPAVSAQLVSERPDVRAASGRLDAARGALAVARAARIRDVDVTVGFDHWPASLTNTQGTGDSFTFGASVPLQIFDSGRGPVGHAVADVDVAQTELRRSETAAEIEIRTATEELARADALAQRYRTDLVPSATQILDAEELAYRRGGASLLDLLDARRNARQVSLAAVAARRDAEVAAARLQLALGREPLSLFRRNP